MVFLLFEEKKTSLEKDDKLTHIQNYYPVVKDKLTEGAVYGTPKAFAIPPSLFEHEIKSFVLVYLFPATS